MAIHIYTLVLSNGIWSHAGYGWRVRLKWKHDTPRDRGWAPCDDMKCTFPLTNVASRSPAAKILAAMAARCPLQPPFRIFHTFGSAHASTCYGTRHARKDRFALSLDFLGSRPKVSTSLLVTALRESLAQTPQPEPGPGGPGLERRRCINMLPAGHRHALMHYATRNQV